ncbi:hypothetical protein S245_051504, partial [Arachis hypogaea]
SGGIVEAMEETIIASSRLKWETSNEGLEKWAEHSKGPLIPNVCSLEQRDEYRFLGEICRSDRKIFSFTSSISLLLLILRSDDVGCEDLRLDLGDGKEKQEDKMKRLPRDRNISLGWFKSCFVRKDLGIDATGIMGLKLTKNTIFSFVLSSIALSIFLAEQQRSLVRASITLVRHGRWISQSAILSSKDVTESGWPSKGGSNEPDATIDTANTYNSNLIKHVLNQTGTPKYPEIAVSTCIYELYNEDMKLGPLSEKNWGLFNANGAPKKGKTPDSCHFDGVASISTTDPRKEKQEDNVNRVQQQEGRVKRVK